ncbi:sarcosine oxidase subunit delta [Kaustia mangrovi]|uniref:Sarcosine oxidase subunit delta n=1 Tax=Kaustia mangrovi TaxID=2593653 RepID=A0A7S8HC84_9HYPH|nr:sarcosine oxidase subunit delta [Kaustia mangrovi]QPC43199.1 sarcosine oxidase subunit delta [Kaustia mangrovi]
MRIDCPCCGPRDHDEFAYGGDASRTMPDIADTGMERWFDHVFLRDNPRGPHREFWHHAHGCRQWLVVERDTVTHEIAHVAFARGEVSR